MTEIASIDLTDIGLWMTDPYPALRRLREEDPVFWFEPPPGNPVYKHPYWALTRHEDVVYVSRHPELFASGEGTGKMSIVVGFSDYDTFAMLNADDPYHAWMRALVSKVFTAKMVKAAEPHVRERAAWILDGLQVRRHEEIDFVHEVATPLPVGVIGDVLGVPPEDMHLIGEWTDSMVDLNDLTIAFAAGTAHSAKASAAVEEMFAYLSRMQQIRQAAPTQDLVSKLMGAEINGERLNWRQQRECFFILATAGNDTTRNTISAGVKALFENPGQRADLAADPQLGRGAVEEMLRWGTVVIYFRRTATQDTELGGKQIKKGDWVVMYYSAANRDPAVFLGPDVFDIRRSPNDHVAFGGGGPHFCLGAPLARLELRVFFEEFLRRYPGYEVTGETPYIHSNLFHGIASMPVVLQPK